MELNPQQLEFIKYYFDKKEDTFGNAYQAGIKAGFSDEYSRNITHLMPKWLSEFIEDERLIKKAYRNLDMALDGLLDDPEKGAKNLQYKASELTLKTRQKEKFSERTEVTGADGKDLAPILVKFINGEDENN